MGLTETGPWFQGKVGALFPQPTIFDQLTDKGLTWRNYFNDTPWELMIATLSHNPEHLLPVEQFYEDAKSGNLPNFAWINPRGGVDVARRQGCNDDHPDHDIALGEQYYKDIYEALRASPQWNETLFIITFDEHGGFYDHVPPPMNVPPPGDFTPSYPDRGVQFDRLGVRLPTLLISPWVPKGLVLSGPPPAQKPAPNSEYTLTSIIATVRKLLDFSDPTPLTKRDAWSATFEQVIDLPYPRSDCPLHLPSAPPLSAGYSIEKEAALPINGLQEHIMTVHAHLAGVDYPTHLPSQGHVSGWLQEHFQHHKDRTLAWKASKQQQGQLGGGGGKALWVALDAQAFANWTYLYWNISIGPSFSTIATANNQLCLDYNLFTSTVGVSNCYPSNDPNTNRDPSQQWVWGDDSMVHPFGYPGLCLTNYMLEGDQAAYLLPCDKDYVGQYWEFDGQCIDFGSGEYVIGVLDFVPTTTSRK